MTRLIDQHSPILLQRVAMRQFRANKNIAQPPAPPLSHPIPYLITPGRSRPTRTATLADKKIISLVTNEIFIFHAAYRSAPPPAPSAILNATKISRYQTSRGATINRKEWNVRNSFFSHAAATFASAFAIRVTSLGTSARNVERRCIVRDKTISFGIYGSFGDNEMQLRLVLYNFKNKTVTHPLVSTRRDIRKCIVIAIHIYPSLKKNALFLRQWPGKNVTNVVFAHLLFLTNVNSTTAASLQAIPIPDLPVAKLPRICAAIN